MKVVTKTPEKLVLRLDISDSLANARNPFKNPVIMADEGAVFIPKDKTVLKEPYIGRSISDVSKADQNTVVQGYAPYLLMKMEKLNENRKNEMPY